MQAGRLLRSRFNPNTAHRIRARALDGLWRLFLYTLVAGISFIIIYPLLSKVSVAFKDKQDIYNPMVFLIPENFTLDNIATAIQILDYFPTLGKTTLFVLLLMVLQTASCALAGYGFARFHFPLRNVLFVMVVLTILVPMHTLMVPMYLHFRHFDFLGIVSLVHGTDGVNLINTYWPAILTGMTANGLKSGLYIYIFRQFFRGMPKEIEEAALIDGAGGIRTFFSIMLPNAIPPLITVMLFAFVWQYNDTFYASLFMSEAGLMSSKIASLPASANLFIGETVRTTAVTRADPNHIAMLVDTGILLAIVPLVAMYLFVQRYFVESVERSGVVG